MATKRLSASLIKTLKECSWRYWASYELKFPDIPNTGSLKGSVTHDVLEILLKQPRHRKKVEKAIADNTCKNIPALWKLIEKTATKYNINEPKELRMIDKFMVVALKDEFYGPQNTIETEVEKKFEIKIEEEGKNYYIKGFIDKIFRVDGETGISLKVVDYKTSKSKYEESEIDDNIQSQIYQLALKHLYPEIKNRNFEFMFLKFADDPIQKTKTLSDEELSGFEHYLTYIQEKVDNFTEHDATENLAAFNEENNWLCGKEGIKMDGSPKFICPFRRPATYYILLDKDGKKMLSSFNKDELKPKEGESISEVKYSGCPYYFDENGKPRKLQFE